MHCVVEDNHQAIGAICSRFAARRVEVFNSVLRGVNFQAVVSDVDFLVEFDPASCLPPLDGFFGLQAETAGARLTISHTCSIISTAFRPTH